MSRVVVIFTDSTQFDEKKTVKMGVKQAIMYFPFDGVTALWRPLEVDSFVHKVNLFH
jgi:hypothetical protein